MKSRIWVAGGLMTVAVLATVLAVQLPYACASASPQAAKEPPAPTKPATAAIVSPKPPPTVEPAAPSEAPSASATPIAPSSQSGPRVVMIGFDGASFELAKKFMDEGRMPWCKKLAESGSFAPLGSANPAESPVAWASINTGMNPGKTNIFGFIRRTFRWTEKPGEKPGEFKVSGYVSPSIGYNRDVDVPFGSDDSVKMSVTENDLRCRNFWDLLDDAGLGSRILQAACNYPAKGGEHTRLLAGLSVPDVRGGPGTFLAYTNSEWDFRRSTDNGGEVYKFKVVCPTCKKSFSFSKGCTKCADGKKVGYFETKLEGPENFVASQKKSAHLKELDKRFRDAKEGTPEKTQAQRELNIASNELKTWEKDNKHVSVPLVGWIDKAERTIRFKLADREFTVKEGEWSEFVPVTFAIEGAFPVKGTAHLHVWQCNEKDEDVRFYLPAVTSAADLPTPNVALTSPPDFGKELVSDVGLFDTIGWSCQTHALKDGELPDASFVSAIWDTIQWRRKMLLTQLAKPDWRTLFQVFGETDRVQHMMYCFFDPKHPQFKAEEAEKTARFGDREIKLKDVIPAVYEEIDETIGLVMSQIEKGELGDCTLLVCSDHGFSSFREEVELNAWLIENGFMTVRTDPGTNAPVTSTKVLTYVDWSKTKAYANGIGTVYLNLKGREPDGIVDPADYDKVCDEILAKMRVYKNPSPASANDPQVFKGAWKRSQFLAGPYAADIRSDVKLPLSGKTLPNACTEGAADIQVGFNLGYRIGWGTALGDRAKSGPVSPNKSRWSGDHTSVHPYLVRGIFLSNKKLAAGAMPHLQDLAPTILALHGVAIPADVDGHVIPLAGLEEAAQKHKGGTANRESLIPPEW